MKKRNKLLKLILKILNNKQMKSKILMNNNKKFINSYNKYNKYKIAATLKNSHNKSTITI